jgi:nicotinamidase-related amidase
MSSSLEDWETQQDAGYVRLAEGHQPEIEVASSTIPSNFIEQSKEFLSALVSWQRGLPTLAWSDLGTEAQQNRVALFSLDMTYGFCHEGALASPHVKGIIPAVVAAFEGAYAIGVRNFVLPQDCHTPDALEFAAYPPHCQVGTSEADTVPELRNLPFARLFEVMPKNSLSSFFGTGLHEWLNAHRDLSTVVVVGNCTDLCVYLLALDLKLCANAHTWKVRVIVPENAVQTYDMPVETANALGTLPHNAVFMHLLFLYHMQLNGVEVVKEVL